VTSPALAVAVAALILSPPWSAAVVVPARVGAVAVAPGFAAAQHLAAPAPSSTPTPPPVPQSDVPAPDGTSLLQASGDSAVSIVLTVLGIALLAGSALMYRYGGTASEPPGAVPGALRWPDDETDDAT